ncbi:hypothetical protein FHS57_006440 [Runella defluvii]|uniref:PIN domain-containing protein n=1 Tax=Runella defluvii TaxID=370973 RepID=A0A7W5ZSN3_9BACT|nr:type II toxin-antitoxin system VapC family toxin [Runella defluvii]MBB3842409.1 hypothetical protein [Runella defluvii]
MILIDSNILIDYFRGNKIAKSFIDDHGKPNLAINTVIAMELYQGALNKAEFGKIKKELSLFLMIDINEDIAQTALKLHERYALSHKISIPDYIIAATALVYDLELLTYNLKDFLLPLP